VDDTFSTVYFPVYCGAAAAPKSYAVGTGSFRDVTWDSAFWVFNQVSNFAYSRYSDMIQDIRKVQQELEGRFLGEQAGVDSAALALYGQSPALARDYLTRYTSETGDAVVARWRELGKFLLYKYLDGNVKNEHGDVTHPKYPEAWYRTIAAATGDRLKTRKLVPEEAAEREEKEKVARTAEGVLSLMSARGLAVDDAARKRILETDDRKQVEAWLVRAATAGSAAEVLEGE
jgi:hypothetical protein